MANNDFQPAHSSSLKLALDDLEDGEILDDYEPRKAKYPRTESRADAWNRRQSPRASLASVSTIQSDTYIGPTASSFQPQVRLDPKYRMSGSPLPETSRRSRADSYRSLSPASPCPSPSRMSMSSWVGNLEISGSPQQISFLSHSHVRDHLGSDYLTNNRIEDFHCGEILIVPWYGPNMDERNAIGTPTVAYASSTGPICAKNRPVVVLFKWGTHIVTLPLASSGGRGLEFKSQIVRETCLPIKQEGDEELRWRTIDHGTACGDFKVTQGTYVQCMQPFTVGLNWPIKRSNGFLDKNSVTMLCLKLADQLLKATDGLSSGTKTLAPSTGVRAGSNLRVLTSQPRTPSTGNLIGARDRLNCNRVHKKRGSLPMVPRSVKLRRATESRRASNLRSVTPA